LRVRVGRRCSKAGGDQNGRGSDGLMNEGAGG